MYFNSIWVRVLHLHWVQGHSAIQYFITQFNGSYIHSCQNFKYLKLVPPKHSRNPVIVHSLLISVIAETVISQHNEFFLCFFFVYFHETEPSSWTKLSQNLPKLLPCNIFLQNLVKHLPSEHNYCLEFSTVSIKKGHHWLLIFIYFLFF